MDVVIGAAFGDEGKGLITDYIASRYGRDAIVVRFNGGAQAGHTVETQDSQRHVFRHVGSGALAGAATFLSRYFVTNPILFLEEMEQLQQKGSKPKVYVDPACLVTTPYDMIINQIAEDFRGQQRHGSCGVGFAETIERNQHAQYSLTVADLEDIDKITSTLQAIRKHWVPHRLQALNISSVVGQWQNFIDSNDIFEFYLQNIKSFLELVTVTCIDLTNCSHPIIFEGAQGLMLDQDQGWFPHVTRSHTGLKNVINLIDNKNDAKLNVIYVTRSYLTRHGAGPLPHELPAQPYKQVVDKTNITNTYQGSLRYAWFNITLLNKFIQTDLSAVPSSVQVDHQLAVTCLDQVDNEITFVKNDKICHAPHATFLEMLTQETNVSKVHCSYGPTRTSIKLMKK
jgi:adenylosuccinate synthase